jgi:kinesin family protein 6/9
LNKIKRAFLCLKDLYLEVRSDIKSVKDVDDNRASDSSSLAKEARDLKSLLLQRDNEIAILVGMVKKGQTVDDIVVSDRAKSSSSAPSDKALPNKVVSSARDIEEVRERRSAPSPESQLQQREKKIIQRHLFGIAPPDDKSLFDDPAACFEWFRERHELNASIDENKNILRDKYNEAKLMGERANQSRNTINYLKNSIEAIRRERAIDGTLSHDSDATREEKEDEEEETYRYLLYVDMT